MRESTRGKSRTRVLSAGSLSPQISTQNTPQSPHRGKALTHCSLCGKSFTQKSQTHYTPDSPHRKKPPFLVLS
ncbi:unnamed protein product, partial [Staurois parvus]